VELDGDSYRWRSPNRLEYLSAQCLAFFGWKLWLANCWRFMAKIFTLDNSDHSEYNISNGSG